ncbi:MAG TPA: ABC transporter permease subunit [Clostridia bacterium]|nr:ABC transporter permease subunit [Clostridia bacterium]
MQEPVENQVIKTSPRGSRPRSLRAASLGVWGQSGAVMAFYHSGALADIVIILGILGVFYGIAQVGREWTGILRPTVLIDLSFGALPRYTFFSLVRGLAAYCISFLFTIVYGFWAAKDKLAERLLVPILDILQSIPVLGFMPGVVLALVSLFPNSNVGLELAAVLMIFTGQAWNMTFSFYNSLKSVPQYLQEAGTIYRFNWWQRLTKIEMPYSAVGLIWNSMMSMAGGWFFLMVTEAFQLGNRDFRLPGIGSYMSVAVEKGNVPAMAAAVVAMVLMIVALDQLLWRPTVVWAQKFRIEDTSDEETMDSWFLDLLHHSHVLRWIGAAESSVRRAVGTAISRVFRRTPREVPAGGLSAPAPDVHETPNRLSPAVVFSRALFLLLAVGLAFALSQIVRLLVSVRIGEWLRLLRSDLLTLARVTAAIALGTLWALPVGLRIGLSPKLSRIMQPVVQVAASFPAPMLFPAVILVLTLLHVNIGFGSIVLMLLGTQWYILFNVIAGAQAIPSDLKEAAASYRVTGRQRFWSLYLPAIFPYLVTGWVTATGGAWNASIVAEIVTFRGQTLRAQGIGSVISEAAFGAHFAELAAAILIMSLTVVLINRFVWRRLYAVASTQYNLSK